MRAMKSTSLSFGLVNVPVKLYKATEESDVRFSQFHDGCGGGVTYVKTCKCCSQQLDNTDIVRGVIRDDKQILVTDDELAGIEVETGPEIAVLQFINSDEIDPIALEQHYFLAPSAASDLEGFMLLRTVMAESGRAAIVKFVMRRTGSVGKEHLGLLRPYGDKAMIIDTLSWSNEIRQPAFSILDANVNINPKVLEMARGLVDAMTAPFDPQAYTDTYTEKLVELIDTKVNGKPKRATKAKTVDPVVSDLLAKLEASAAAKGIKKPAAKKAAPAKKAPAKKAAPRRKTAVA